MTLPGKNVNSNSVESDSLGVRRTPDQEEIDASNRRKTLYETVAQSSDGADLVRLVAILDLGAELADLVAGDPERHRRIAAAQLQLDEETAELSELAKAQERRR